MQAVSFISVCFIAVVSAHELTQTEFDEIYSIAFEACENWEENGGTRNPLVAGVVRLIFHDCVDGCDGCINHDGCADNLGLLRYTDHIEKYIYQAYYDEAEGILVSDLVSRADTWIITSLAALDWSVDQYQDGIRTTSSPRTTRTRTTRTRSKRSTSGTLSSAINFKYGREDGCTDGSTDVTCHLPEPTLGYTEMKGFFVEKFGEEMTDEYITALMGAHSLGWNAKNNSMMFTQRWTAKANDFNNIYYTNLMKEEYYYKNHKTDTKSNVNSYPMAPFSTDRYFWSSEDVDEEVDQDDFTVDGFMMLDTDLNLYRDLDGVDELGGMECPADSCSYVEDYAPNLNTLTSDYVKTFAEDNDAFYASFAEAFELMINNGWRTAQLSKVVDDSE